MRISLFVIFLAVAIAPAAQSAPAAAAENGLIGAWTIVKADPAPWTDEKERARLETRGKRLLNLQITFGNTAVRAKHPTLGCKRARYRAAGYARDALFQGNLPEPHQEKIAKALGFAGEDVPSVDVNCSTGVFSYHFRDSKTAVFALDNVIYTLSRQQ